MGATLGACGEAKPSPGGATRCDVAEYAAADLPRALAGLRPPPAGLTLRVPGGRGYRYQLAAAPGGARGATLRAFDAAGTPLGTATQTDGLPGLQVDRAHTVHLSTTDGLPVHLYVNDPEDRDGDGLGRLLEAALGTCDDPRQPGCCDAPLADYYRAVPGATRDSDRDGLPDGEELLGVAGDDGTPGLDLPRWGADPRHKDVFIEVDYRRRLGSVGLSAEDLREVAALYAEGSAASLRNPDGRDGVRLHFDVGRPPADGAEGADAALFGDYGGSNAVGRGPYWRHAVAERSPARRGYFRYALVDRRGTGQSRGDALTFNHHFHRARVLAHELGHTLGLAHHGHDRWGRANCKPQYVSLMNYLYQNEPSVGFSRGEAVWLDPGAVMERDGRAGLDPALLRAPPLSLDVWGDDVDYNRDGRIEDGPVRAALTWATYKSCAEPAASRSVVFEGALAATRPALVRVGRWLYALFADQAGAVRWARSPVTGPDARGSCPDGDALGARCGRFGQVRTIAGLAGVAHVAATAVPAVNGDADGIAMAVVDTAGALHMARVDVLGGQAPALRLTADVAVAGAHTGSPPALLAQPDGLGGPVALYRGDDGTLWSAGDAVHRERDHDGNAIAIGGAPAALGLPSGETCGAFPDAEGFVRVYCRGGLEDGWEDVSARAFYAGSGPRSEGPVALAYHRYRHADGSPMAADRGALYLAFQTRESAREPNAAWWLVSDWLDRDHGARERLTFRLRGWVLSQWANLAPGAGLALHEDAELSALKALLPARAAGGGPTTLRYLPLADGSYHGELGGGDDFAVMERGICAGLRGERTCGGPATGAY